MIETLKFSAIAWLLNSIYAVTALVIAAVFIWLVNRHGLGRINILTELFKNNLSVAIVVAAVILSVALVVSSAHGAQVTNKYDHFFKKHSRRFFARAVDWHWFKAQGIAESGLDRLAVSSRGARGLMQIMPKTGEEIAASHDIPLLPFSPTISIMMGIAYDRKMWEHWPELQLMERLRFMFASYNAGYGNIKAAWRQASKKEIWAFTAAQLHRVTGKYAKQTIEYVRRIERIKAGMGG